MTISIEAPLRELPMTRRILLLRGDQGVEGVGDLAGRVHHAKVDDVVDFRRHLDGGDEATDGAVANGDGDRADGGEEVVLNPARQVGVSAEAARTTLAVSAMVRRSASQVWRKLATDGT